MGIKDLARNISEVCMAGIMETCRSIGKAVGTLPICINGEHPGSIVTRTEEETIGKPPSIVNSPASDAASPCSEVLTSRRQRLELLRTQCGSEVEYEIKKSTEHWTEVPRQSTIDHRLLFANSKRFKRLMKKWRSPKSEHGFFLNYGERLKMGQKIAEGGQAEIFDARFKGDDRNFVLKVFKDNLLEDLEHLWPPPLLPLLYVDYEPDWMLKERHCCWIRGGTVLKDGRFAFLMDKYEGDLRTYIDQRTQDKNCGGPFEFRDVLMIMLQIAKGMRSLHQRGILHRDLKASNVLLRRHYGDASNPCDFEYVVADFETSVGVFGTGFWRAPEVLLALKNRNFQPEIWTEKIDVYSYAMTCYEIITGHIPFEDLRRNDYDFVLNGGRPQVPLWYWNINYSLEVYWDPNTLRLVKKRVPVPWLKSLLESCWDSDPSKRPTFKDIVETFLMNSPLKKPTQEDIRGLHLTSETWL